MRIIGGTLRGFRLHPPKDKTIRPTSDEKREKLFNILEHQYPGTLLGARVIDLFAGTGALGLESLSRGASHALFVEKERQAQKLIRENIKALKLNKRATLLHRNAHGLGRLGEQWPAFTISFIDPPYEKGLGEKALLSLHKGGWLVSDALCVLEESAIALLRLPVFFEMKDRRVFSRTQFVFLRYLKTP